MSIDVTRHDITKSGASNGGRRTDTETASDKRSSEYSENDLLNIMEQKDSENTKKATQAAVRVFETYLLEHAQVKLAEGVGHFHFDNVNTHWARVGPGSRIVPLYPSMSYEATKVLCPIYL